MFIYTPGRSGRLGFRGGNFVLMHASAVHAFSFLVVSAVGIGNLVMMRVFADAEEYFASLLAWRCGNGFRKQLRKRHRIRMV